MAEQLAKMTILNTEFGAIRIIWPDGFPVDKRLNLADLLHRAFKGNGETGNGKVPAQTVRKEDLDRTTTQLS
jgi:hypothetical protein